MNLHTFQISLFRDKTKLRYTENGRLIIRSEVASVLNLIDKEHIYYNINKIDIDKSKIEFILSTKKQHGSKMHRLLSIRGNRIVHLKSEISQYGTFKSQYAQYDFIDINSICIELYYGL